MSKPKIMAWADGACVGNPGPGGWAAYLVSGTYEREVVGAEGATTNNRMELMAAISALEILKKPSEITVHSDSQYVVKGASTWIKNWKRNGWNGIANRDLWERLDKAASAHEVTWQWVRGHSGNANNERVDRLAVAQAEIARKLPRQAAPKPPETKPVTLDLFSENRIKGGLK